MPRPPRSMPLATIVLAAALVPALVQGADFVPEAVFAGHSRGTGELGLLFGRDRAFTVRSHGVPHADGSFVLTQEVRFEGRPAQMRTWVMRRTGPGTYAATLTGAAGPAVGTVEGSRMTLRYPLTDWGLAMHQTMDLSDDGATVANHGRIRFLGLPVGELREIIRTQP